MQDTRKQTMLPYKELLSRWKGLQKEWKQFCLKRGLDDVLLLQIGEDYDVAGTGNEYRSIGFNALYYKSRKTLDNYLITRRFGKPRAAGSNNKKQDPARFVACYPYGSLSELITFSAENLATSGLGNTPFDDAFILFRKLEDDITSSPLYKDLPSRFKKNMKRLHSLLSNPNYSLANYEEFVKHIMPNPLPNATRFALYWKDTRHEVLYSDLVKHLLGDAILLASLYEKVSLSSDEIVRVYLKLRESLPVSRWKTALMKGASNEEVTSFLRSMIREVIKIIRGGDSFTTEDQESINALLDKEKLFSRFNYNVAKLPRFFAKSLHVIAYRFQEDSEDAFLSDETLVLLLSPNNITQLHVEEVYRFLEKHLEEFREQHLYRMQYFAGPFELMEQVEDDYY